MSTLQLDTDTHDLSVVNNSLVLLNPDNTQSLAETAQRLKTKFQFFLGEWELNPAVGLPYYEDILVKNPNLGRINDLYREVIIADEAIAQLISLQIDLDDSARQLSVSFQAQQTDGQILVFEDFILLENRIDTGA